MAKQNKENKDFLKRSKVYFQNIEEVTKKILHEYDDLFEEARTDKCYLGVVNDLKERLEKLVDSLSDISKQIPEIRQRLILLVTYYDSISDEKDDSIRII